MAVQQKDIDIGRLIVLVLKNKERSVAWLARNVGCDASNLAKTLKNGRYIYTDLLLRISIVLETDFFSYYSEKLPNQIKNR